MSPQSRASHKAAPFALQLHFDRTGNKNERTLFEGVFSLPNCGDKMKCGFWDVIWDVGGRERDRDGSHFEGQIQLFLI